MPPKLTIPVFHAGRWGRLEFAPRRANHGSSKPAEELGQPQDGVAAQEASVQAEAARTVLREPEDARLTGGTRSLMRRVLGLNVTGAMLRPARPQPARSEPARSLPSFVLPASVA